MATIYDHAITEARRVIGAHRPWRRGSTVLCRAGCGQWPCKRFDTAFAIITRNSYPLTRNR
jgi:hypothetical protein